MNKKISLGAAIAVMAIVATLTFSITMVYSRQVFNDTMQNIKERESTYSKLSEIDKWVRQNYYGTIDNNALMDSIARGYIEGLGDPYARYMTVEEYSKLNQTGTSKSVGVGMVTEIDESGYLLVTEVYPDSPALAAGIAAGDLIVKVGDEDLTKDNCEELQQAILGDAGTKVDLVTRRDSVDTPLSLTRRDVEKPSVYYSLSEDKIGYMQIIEFNNSTADQFNRGVDRLVSEGAVALIFDVRNNQGGMESSVTRILDKLLPQGDIVSATYKDGTTEVLATSDPACINLPMVVITNEKTASAAELFTQALKDYNKAYSVGTTTMGKGTMQIIQQLNDGSAIDITVAKYNPPKSPNFDGVGIKPDYEVQVSKDLGDAIANMSMKTNEQVQTALEIDPQLKKAMELAQSGANASSSSEGSSSEAETDTATEEENEDENA